MSCVFPWENPEEAADLARKRRERQAPEVRWLVVACISCGKALQPAGKALHCRCGGAWLAETVLLDMAARIRGALVKLPWAARAGQPRPCPMCAAGMQMVALGGIELDRCAPHGIWFDATELDGVLNVSKGFPLAATSTRFVPSPRAKRPSLDLLSDLRGAFFEEGP